MSVDMTKVPVDVVDGMSRLEKLLAFLDTACLAIAEQSDGSMVVNTKAWEGLYYWTQYLEDVVCELNLQVKMAERITGK